MMNYCLDFQVQHPFNFTGSGGYIGSICLPRKGENVVGNVTVSGWGESLFY